MLVDIDHEIIIQAVRLLLMPIGRRHEILTYGDMFLRLQFHQR